MTNDLNFYNKIAKHSLKKKLIILIVLLIFLFLLIAICYVNKKYTIDTVVVEGNTHYTDEQIEDMILNSKLSHNSIYLSLLYHNKEIKNIPFIETMDITIVSCNTVKIQVYEKAVAGFVEFLGKYMYFDKDGIIIESSEEKLIGIPQVSGLKYGYVVLYEKLPVDDESIFKQILNVTQLLNKYDIYTDKILFDEELNMTLYFEQVKVTFGNISYLDEKIMKLKSILPELKGKKGTLRMENFTYDTKNITFQLDK